MHRNLLKAAYWLGRFDAIDEGRAEYPKQFIDRLKADLDLLDEDSSEDDERLNREANRYGV